MKKLIICGIVSLVSAVYQITSLPVFAVDGLTVIEKRAVLIALLCTTFSLLFVLIYIQGENKKSRREIVRIGKEIARNEAQQRRLLREMYAIHENPVQPEIMSKLPKRK